MIPGLKTGRSSAPAAAVLVLLAVCGPRCLSAEVTVIITEPRPAEVVFGETPFEAEIVTDAPLARVEFFVDGRFVASRSEAPWRVEVDVGEDNAEHRFEVVAEDVHGERGSSLLVSRRIEVDDEIDLELRQLYVTVSRDGERVLDLDAGDFTVLDRGAPQTLVTFEGGDVPMVALLLVDASDSMRGDRLRAAVAGARAFISGMQPLDQAKLLLFSDRVLHTTPFTNFAEILVTGLAGVEARGDTALNDHLYLALRRLDERQGRRVVVLLSDGVDVASILRAREVLEIARRSTALIYWIRLGRITARTSQTSAWRGAAEHWQEYQTLEQTVRESGGRILTLDTVEGTAAAFSRVLQELREQYVLGYYPSVSRGDDAWHDVVVRVRERGLEVRARAGYFDD
jgi:Ca-activated chloride channel family protein